ncbi:MAG TPA: TadE family protein [Terriglobia bacterium]|nr:TadE family protein [Terriglobia bacterium]
MMKNNMKKVRASQRDDQGASVLEFGLVVLVFYAFVFGVMDFGRALYSYHFVSHAAREATRYAIVHGAQSSDPATANEIAQYVKNITPDGIDPNAITVSTTWSPDNTPGSNVRIQVQDNFHFVMPLLLTTQMNLSSASQMVISN